MLPYLDDLHSAIDDSDGEDLEDRLSPSDGFTSPSSSNFVPHVPNVIIEDPTLQQQAETTAESKAREASEEGRSSAQVDPAHYATNTAAYSLRVDTLGRDTAVAPFAPSAAGPPSSSSHAHTYSQSSASRTPLRTYTSVGRSPSVYPDAPPAYTPSPSSPLSPSSQQENARNYSTFSPSMGIPETEQERLLGREPESMADHPGDEESVTPVWRQPFGRRLPTWFRWKIALISSVLLAITVGFLASSFNGIRGGHETPSAPKQPAEPINEPGEPGQPGQPVTGSPNEPGWSPFEPVVCRDAPFHFEDEVLPLVFDQGRSVSFIEEGDEHTTGIPVRVAGYVQVRQVDEDGDPRILLELATNEEDLRIDIFLDEESQTLRVKVPQKFDSTKYKVPCVEMRATIFVPRDGNIGGFTVSATHLDVLLLEALSLNVADFSRISSVVGNIASAASYLSSHESNSAESKDLSFVPAKGSYNFDSRVIEVSTTTGKIHGNWPLYDMLGLHTTSGDIRASITPKEALASDPKPAVLSITSISGAIQAAEPIHGEEQIPLRDYLVDIRSTSGDIHAFLAIGTGAELKSTSSAITVDLLPVVNKAKVTPENPAQLETVTTSGATLVHILEPVWFEDDSAKSVAGEPKDVPYIPVGDDGPYDVIPTDRKRGSSSAVDILDRLQAIHKSTSGLIGLNYPQSWEGNLFIESMSGSLKVKGRDVRIVKKSSGWPRNTHARKGNGDGTSLTRVHTLSGNVDALIGDER